MYVQTRISRTEYGGGENLLACGSVMKPPREIRELAGKARFAYLDPPFMTGKAFSRKRLLNPAAVL